MLEDKERENPNTSPTTIIAGTGSHARFLSFLTGANCIPIEDINTDDRAWVIVGVGDIQIRVDLYEKYHARIASFIAETAVYASNIMMKPGIQFMPGSYIAAGCKIGANVLVNTRSQIDHDCVIGDHCIISPGVVICGNVTLGDRCQIGAGTTIINGVNLRNGTKIPAGSLVCGQMDIRIPQRGVFTN